ncbi:M50 family metallopeptidase [Yinghuangia seranimata]|uniref:M50 family metallopeptidase n=1 Tax=Yinghuangia seranimata TaxID=408067 RepID=UPI00248CFDE4|nr:M50 family metallopeptidase [Yinghuangia seranimata]MDI2127274.1 M50 family metallopeptidase [Yinghuangia seranimata]MDI2132219.1 M50 family metallopeptidase [Yinghuangia seranimata]
METVSLQELWDRVTGTQPDPPRWLILATGLAAVLAVLYRPVWRPLRTVVTIAHEGGHALAALATGRRLTGIRLHSDTSGVTVSVGKPTGLGMVLTAFAGYVTPSLLGAGGAALLANGHITMTLWITLLWLALMLTMIRNLYGAFALVLVGGVVFAVSWLAKPDVQAGFAYLLVWFLLAAGIRPVVELQQMRRRRQAQWSDADQLATLTRIPGAAWVGLFGIVSAVSAGTAAGWLVA